MKKSTHKNILQTVIEFGLSIRKESRHPIQVCRLCCMLFDELQSLHRMGNTERIWLQTAAILHDIGKSVCRQDHNKRSREIIVKSSRLPFSKKERKIIALTARYHRGALPNRSHKYYGKLDSESRYYIRKLASLLRLADGLDNNHKSSIIDLSCQITEDNIIIYPEINGAFNASKAISKADLFEFVFGRDVIITEQLEPVFPFGEIDLSDDLDFTDPQY